MSSGDGGASDVSFSSSDESAEMTIYIFWKILIRYAYGIYSSQIWLVRMPSKPISHENGSHMHFIAQNTLKFKFHKKEKLILKDHKPTLQTTESDENCT